MHTGNPIRIRNTKGMELTVLPLGATIHSLKLPDKKGRQVDIILGLKSVNDYVSPDYILNNAYLGSTVGRFAGRIREGKFEINGQAYRLHQKNEVHLHGGKEGFDRKYWNVVEYQDSDNPFVKLSYISGDMEEGYPGSLEVSATFKVTDLNELIIIYEASSRHTTVANITNHAYFNLSGKGSVLDHHLHVASDNILELQTDLLPTGKLIAVKNTPFDYRTTNLVGRQGFTGLDDVFILKESIQQVSLYSESTGIRMRVTTNQPAAVIYTPPTLDLLEIPERYMNFKYPAICIETQNYPDAPNHANFPSAIVSPDKAYTNRSVFAFDIV